MRTLLSTILLLAINATFAQLNVTNDTFMLVAGDNLLYVQNEINLKDAQSTIYLRDEAQILQGNNVANKGLGELSVYQESTSNEFQYTYWCSPIGNVTDNSTNNAFGIPLLNDVQTLLDSNPATFAHSSDYNGTSSPLNIEPYWIWKYIASGTYSDWIHVQSSLAINPGEGFTMKGTMGSAGSQRYDFRGKPNSGDIGVAVAAPVAGIPQQTLVGNPYPSAMDAMAYIHDADNKSAITGTLLYWEQTSTSHNVGDYEGGYATYTINSIGTIETFTPAVYANYDGAGTYTGNSGTNGSKTARRYIPIGQGFMVEGITGSTGTVYARNSHRVFYRESSAASEFFRPSENTSSQSPNTHHTISYNELGFSIIPAESQRFRLNVIFNNDYTRSLVQTFDPTATHGFDYGLESVCYEKTNADAYWVIDGTPYVAQAFKFDEILNIPLVIKLNEQQVIGLNLCDVQNFVASQPIYIHDKQTDVYIDLRTEEFSITLPQGNYTDRFEITFRAESLTVTDDLISEFEMFQDNTKSRFTLLNPNGSRLKSLNIIDISGKSITRVTDLNRDNHYHLSTAALSDGIYIANVTTETNQIISKKLIVKN